MIHAVRTNVNIRRKVLRAPLFEQSVSLARSASTASTHTATTCVAGRTSAECWTGGSACCMREPPFQWSPQAYLNRDTQNDEEPKAAVEPSVQPSIIVPARKKTLHERVVALLDELLPVAGSRCLLRTVFKEAAAKGISKLEFESVRMKVPRGDQHDCWPDAFHQNCGRHVRGGGKHRAAGQVWAGVQRVFRPVSNPDRRQR